MTVTFKPTNMPALGYNSIETLSLQVHSTYLCNVLAHRDLEILRKSSKRNVRKVADIPRPYSSFSDSMLVVDPFSSFTTVNMVKMDTLCNENNYKTEKQEK